MAAPRIHRTRPPNGKVQDPHAPNQGDLHRDGKGPSHVHRRARARCGAGKVEVHLRGVYGALPRAASRQEGDRGHHACETALPAEGDMQAYRQGEPLCSHHRHAQRHVHRHAERGHQQRCAFRRVLRESDTQQREVGFRSCCGRGDPHGQSRPQGNAPEDGYRGETRPHPGESRRAPFRSGPHVRPRLRLSHRADARTAQG